MKVALLYREAANVIKKVKSRECTAKNAIFLSVYENKKVLQAVVFNTLANETILQKVISECHLLEKIKDKRLVKWSETILVFLFELLLGTGSLDRAGQLKKEIVPHADILRNCFEALKAKEESPDVILDKSRHVNIPRYVRINRLRTTDEVVMETLKEQGYRLRSTPDDYDKFLSRCRKLSGLKFMRDFHMLDMLVFPSTTEFHHNDLYIDNAIILQDKASCLPVNVLQPPKGAIVLDCCAAPGNKTSQLSAAVGRRGRVYAVELNKKRCDVLRSRMEALGASRNVHIYNKDVLECLGMEDVMGVTHVLLDPSCSGSGIVSREKETFGDSEPTRDQKQCRLAGLASLQCKLLRNVLTRLPNVQKVVYSTCSLFKEENEEVVKDVLRSVSGFRLVSCFPSWRTRAESFIGNACLAATLESDLTNGFFVACFERILNK